MTWTPRNRSEDEEEDENIDLEKNDDDEPNKPTDKGESTDTEAGRLCRGEGRRGEGEKKKNTGKKNHQFFIAVVSTQGAKLIAG